MKDHVKIKTDGSLMNMPELYRASWDIRNDEETQDFCANHDNWLLKQDTEQPAYDPETQYLTFHYEKQGDCAVQVWEIHDIETSVEESDNE